MRLKVTQPEMAGGSATVWIDGEVTKDVVSLVINMDAKSFSTVTMTRILHGVEFDGFVEDAEPEATS